VSLRILVIPEDPTYNGHILKPLVERMLAECGKRNVRVTVLTNPKLNGFEHACYSVRQILYDYQHFDLFLFLVDADGKDRSGTFQELEALSGKLLCCAAKQEVEVWLLAGHQTKLGRDWKDVRDDASVKENVFLTFLAQHGDSRRYGEGRDLLMQETLNNYRSLKQRCPELGDLERRIRELLASKS